MTHDIFTISPGPRFRAAMMLAIIADALQIVVFPLFIEGAASPADDILDLGVGAALVYLLGWHWEFLPSFFAKLVPGVDLVPFWTMAVANVYRKSKPIVVTTEEDGKELDVYKRQDVYSLSPLRWRLQAARFLAFCRHFSRAASMSSEPADPAARAARAGFEKRWSPRR